MSKYIDLTNERFNRLTIIKQVDNYISPKGFESSQWLCKCDCGNITIQRTYALKKGLVQSCGCLQKEIAQKNGKNNKKYNKYDLSNSYGVGYTSNTNEEFYFDIEDYDKIKDYCWNYNGRYISTVDKNNKKTLKLQRVIMNPPHSKVVDHINHNIFDNRKKNLRVCTQHQNSMNTSIPKSNTSGIMGVNFHKTTHKWQARLGNKYLGVYENKEDAIKARLLAEKEYYKEFAPQRHLFKEYNI